MKVLIVDDNPQIIETIADFLSLEGMIVDMAYHGEAAINLLQKDSYDVIIMDIMMPKIDGIATVKRIRSEMLSTSPILFLTAKGDLSDKVLAYQAGGDDYLVKPFELTELSLKIHALGARGLRSDRGMISFGELTFDTRNSEVLRQGKAVKLSQFQFDLLKLFVVKAPNIVTRQEIIDHLWEDEAPMSDSLRSHIYNLRTALDKGFDSSVLETVHGKGYRLKA